MTIKRTIGSWGAAAIFAAICLAPTSAFAESECSVDSDCSGDFVCEVTSAPCPSYPPCDSTGDEPCPEPPACEPEEQGRCVAPPPAACETAADCEDGLVCVTYTYETCSDSVPVACGEGVPGDEACPEYDPSGEPECSTETEGLCLPKYLAPCEVAADCGEGFECKAQEICSCSGGGGIDVDYVDAGMAEGGSDPGSPGADAGGSVEGEEGGGEAPMPGTPGEDCTCEPGDVKYCDLPMQECEADAECPGELVCGTLPGGASPSPGGTCTSTPGGETVCEDDPTAPDVDPKSYCLPADLDRWFGQDIPGYNGQASDESDPNSPGSGSSSQDDDRAPVGAEVDRGSFANAGGDPDSGCGCASTADALPGSFAAFFFALLGMAGFRRRSS